MFTMVRPWRVFSGEKDDEIDDLFEREKRTRADMRENPLHTKPIWITL